MAQNMFAYWILNLTDTIMRDKDGNFPETKAFQKHHDLHLSMLFPKRSQLNPIKLYMPPSQHGRLPINWNIIRDIIRERLIIKRSPLQPPLRHYRST